LIRENAAMVNNLDMVGQIHMDKTCRQFANPAFMFLNPGERYYAEAWPSRRRTSSDIFVSCFPGVIWGAFLIAFFVVAHGVAGKVALE
jgi:hypothetical protein